MNKTFNAIISKEKKQYVALCIELGVVSQGKSFSEAEENLKEAVELYIESFKYGRKKELIIYPKLTN